MDYFCSKSPESSNAGTPPPNPLLDSMTRKCAKTLLPLNIFGLMQMLENSGAKRNLNFIFSAPSLFKIRARATKWGDIYRRYKQIHQFSKKLEYACKIMCFILNVIIVRPKFSAHLIFLSFSKFSYRQNMF